ncbi:MAG: DUF4259 domain-containing protein [Aquimonas sp.]|jgi:hypothetical protein
MGTWGTGPFDNDTALDLLDSFKRVRKSHRAKRAEVVLRAYLEFDSRLQRGENIQSLDEAEVAELRGSRSTTLEWYASMGEPPPVDVFPELASEDSWEAYVQELSAPKVDDGSHEALRAIAIADLVAEAIESRSGALGGPDRHQLVPLAALCSDVLKRILDNELFRASWQLDELEHLTSSLKELALRLRPVA